MVYHLNAGLTNLLLNTNYAAVATTWFESCVVCGVSLLLTFLAVTAWSIVRSEASSRDRSTLSKI